jgi:Exopolysaccharide biosynthesis protein YbjH
MGAINTPTAQTLPVGSVLWGFTNNVPEQARMYPGQGAFGSTSLGFGILPNLDASVRLAYDGDPNCNQFLPGCSSASRDLSLNAKWQLPVELPGNSRLALGVTDFGGAATNFRQSYGVWTSRLQSWDLSLGYSKGISPLALIHGPFASVSYWSTPEFKTSLETRQNETRMGVEWQHRINAKWWVTGGLSSSIATTDNRQKYQANFNLIYSWERDHQPDAVRAYGFGFSTPVQQQKPSATAARLEPATPMSLLAAPPASHQSNGATPNATPNATINPVTSTSVAKVGDRDNLDVAQNIKNALHSKGFSHIAVGLENSGNWHVKAEPLAWRKSQLTALAHAIAAVLPLLEDKQLLFLTLQYQQQSHRNLIVQRGCRAVSNLVCLNHQNITFEIQDISSASVSPNVQWLIEPDWWQRIGAELEVGPALRQTVGTEYGLADYSLGLDTGWQVPVAGIPGLFAQGSMTRALSHSDDFGPGKVFSAMKIENQVQQSLLSYVMHPSEHTFLQANYGYINTLARGSQINGAWLSQDTRLKLDFTSGQFTIPQASYLPYKTKLVSARYELIPTLWALQLSGGQYYYGDKGWQLSSQHWFSNHRLEFYVRQSASPSMPQTRFAGFTVSIPMGPSESFRMGQFSIRGRDFWSDGLESKIGSTNNLITTGYGVEPVIRHGLNDMLDYDRRSNLNFMVNIKRLTEELNDIR